MFLNAPITTEKQFDNHNNILSACMECMFNYLSCLLRNIIITVFLFLFFFLYLLV